MDRYSYRWYTILLEATRALAHIGVHFTHRVIGLSRVSLIDVKKRELTLRVGDEAVHFNINQSLKQPEFDNANCKNVETMVPISSKLHYDCKIQSSMNENEKLFRHIEDLDVEFLNSGFEFKETRLLNT